VRGLRSDIEDPTQVSDSRKIADGNEPKVTCTEQKSSQRLSVTYAHMAMHKPISSEIRLIYQYRQMN